MTITVQQVFENTMMMDQISLSHRIFWAISKGLVTANCSSDLLSEIEYNEEEIEQMANNNLLQIGKIKLFVAKIDDERFAFYYAESNLEAYMLHQDTFGRKPKHITEGNRLMGKWFYFEKEKDSEMLFFYRKRIVNFPYFLGVAFAGVNTIYKEG